MLAAFNWNLDPVLVETGKVEIWGHTFGPLMIRYYGVVFVVTILVAFQFWKSQMRRGGHSEGIVHGFFVWGVAAVIIGARLGHCFFYDASFYLSHPELIPQFWRGGLASHGAAIGLITALILYARRHRLPILDVIDRFAMSAAMGAAGIRLGNFLNSEIAGRPTSVPWAVRFMLYEENPIPRHPSQLYEFAIGLSVLAVLVLADRLAGKEKRPRGLMAGLFLTLYFAGRFCVEFFKEYHIEALRGGLTMGQYLSIIPFICGVVMLIWVHLRSAGDKAADNSVRKKKAVPAGTTGKSRGVPPPSGRRKSRGGG